MIKQPSLQIRGGFSEMLSKIIVEDGTVSGKNKITLLIQLSDRLNSLPTNFISVLLEIFGVPLGTTKDPEIVKNRPHGVKGKQNSRSGFKRLRTLVGGFQSMPFSGSKSPQQIMPTYKGLMTT